MGLFVWFLSLFPLLFGLVKSKLRLRAGDLVESPWGVAARWAVSRPAASVVGFPGCVFCAQPVFRWPFPLSQARRAHPGLTEPGVARFSLS